jgi:sulfate adenylyltransferase subunit 1 (EFTu-like GTPase family)
MQLADDIDISRGALVAPVHHAPAGLAPAGLAPAARKEVRARVCWLDGTPLAAGKVMQLQHGVLRVRAKVSALHSVIDVVTLQHTQNPSHLMLNEIGEVTVRLSQPIFADPYAANPPNGACILIDELSSNTAGVAFVQKEKLFDDDFE